MTGLTAKYRSSHLQNTVNICEYIPMSSFISVAEVHMQSLCTHLAHLSIHQSMEYGLLPTGVQHTRQAAAKQGAFELAV